MSEVSGLANSAIDLYLFSISLSSDRQLSLVTSTSKRFATGKKVLIHSSAEADSTERTNFPVEVKRGD